MVSQWNLKHLIRLFVVYNASDHYGEYFNILVCVCFIGERNSKMTWGSKLSFFRVINTNYLSFTGLVNLLLGIIFMVMPFQSALVVNYVIAAYLIVAGISLLIEAISMKKI